MGFTVAYKKLFELALWHHYFLDSPDDGVFVLPPTGDDQLRRLLAYDLRRVVSIRLSADSEKTLNRLGLIFKQTHAGCLVASRKTFVETDPSTKLTMLMNIEDPSFLARSRVGFTRWENKVFYLCNFNQTPPEFAFLGGFHNSRPQLDLIERIPWSTRIVRLLQLTPGTDTTIEVMDVNSAVATPVLTFNLHSEPNQTSYELDCRTLREGLYRFTGSNIPSDSYYYLGLEDQQGVFGIVEFFLKDLSTASEGTNTQYELIIEKP